MLEKALQERENYFAERYNIDVRLNTEAVSIDMDSKCLLINKNGQSERIKFDALIYAGGAISKNLNFKIDLDSDKELEKKICHFRNLDDLEKIRKLIKSGAKQAVVLGCGLYGMSAAQALVKAGLKVKIVEKEKRIAPRFALSYSKEMLLELKKLGVEVELDKSIESLEDFRKIKSDIVVIAIGSEPRTELLARAGVSLQKDGSIRVDQHMQTSLDSIYACGSVVSVPQAITLEKLWIPQPAVIDRTAQIAGQNAVQNNLENFDRLGSMSGTQLFSIGKKWFARTGLTKLEARKFFGDSRVHVSTTHSGVSEKWVGDEKISISLILDSQDKKIVGGEIFGTKGVTRRIDLLAAAVSEGWGPEKLIGLDMSYAADLGPAFDPLKEVARLAQLSFSGEAKSIGSDNLALWMAQKKDFKLLNISDEISLGNIRKKLKDFDQSLPIVLSSSTGRRALLAQRVLLQNGFLEVYHLDGGQKTWDLVMGS